LPPLAALPCPPAPPARLPQLPRRPRCRATCRRARPATARSASASSASACVRGSARIADEGRKRHVCRIAADWRDVIADREVDAVLVGTPDHWHAEPAIAAALAGKHVFCEKPLTLTIAEGRAIAAAVAATDVCFQTGSQQRSEFGHHFVRAAEAVRNGRIGKVRRITIHTGDPAIACDLPAQPLPEGIDWDGWVGQAPMRPFHADLCPIGMHGHFPAWRKYREYANGGLADMGAHHFDIAQWALGMDHSGPVRVLPPADREAKRGLVLVYADGCEMVHGGPTDCTFEGELGTIECSRGHSRAFRGTDRSAPDAPELLAEPKDGELRFPRNKGHVADFLRLPPRVDRLPPRPAAAVGSGRRALRRRQRRGRQRAARRAGAAARLIAAHRATPAARARPSPVRRRSAGRRGPGGGR